MDKKTLAAALAVFAAVAAVACGGGGDEAPAAGGSGTPALAPAAIDPATIADPGTITGSINFGGDAPEAQALQVGTDPFCVAANPDHDVLSPRLVVNDNGTLRHVFVYVKGGLEGQSFVDAGEAVTLNQTACMYVPHVIGVQTNQTLTIVNNDDTLHNINAQPIGNQGFNYAQPIKDMTTEQTFVNAEVMIAVRCDVHPWMQAFVGVVDHPYFAVSGEDGSFSISNLPAGTYTIGAWHESLGEQEQSVTVDANGTAEVTFDFGS